MLMMHYGYMLTSNEVYIFYYTENVDFRETYSLQPLLVYSVQNSKYQHQLDTLSLKKPHNVTKYKIYLITIVGNG